MRRHASYRYQLEEWVKDNPLHNTVMEECCPDFSCCQKELLMNERTRQVFKTAFDNEDSATMSEIMGMALGKAIGHVSGGNVKVHIVGVDEPNSIH